MEFAEGLIGLPEAEEVHHTKVLHEFRSGERSSIFSVIARSALRANS